MTISFTPRIAPATRRVPTTIGPGTARSSRAPSGPPPGAPPGAARLAEAAGGAGALATTRLRALPGNAEGRGITAAFLASIPAATYSPAGLRPEYHRR